jgi:hypothetical protein
MTKALGYKSAYLRVNNSGLNIATDDNFILYSINKNTKKVMTQATAACRPRSQGQRPERKHSEPQQLHRQKNRALFYRKKHTDALPRNAA